MSSLKVTKRNKLTYFRVSQGLQVKSKLVYESMLFWASLPLLIGSFSNEDGDSGTKACKKSIYILALNVAAV